MSFDADALVYLEPGDLAPAVSFGLSDGRSIGLLDDDLSGHFHVLVFAGKSPAATAHELQEIATATANLPVDLRLVVTKSDAAQAVMQAAPSVTPTVMLDPEGKAYHAYGLSAPFGSVLEDGPTTVVVGPNNHLLSWLAADDRPHADAVTAGIAPVLAPRKPFEPVSHPPVLMIPGVMSPDDCEYLISVFEEQGQEFIEPGHMALKDRTTDVKMRIPEYGRQDRIDHWVVESETADFINHRLKTRLFPEIKKAFQYKITKHERYRIAQYEGTRGGELHGHRDDSQEAVAYRRFAVTVNLNSADYEGGELRFPEFSEQLYKPETGSAIVFSCSLLHEVMHMRAGRRYALLAFLFGDV